MAQYKPSLSHRMGNIMDGDFYPELPAYERAYRRHARPDADPHGDRNSRNDLFDLRQLSYRDNFSHDADGDGLLHYNGLCIRLYEAWIPPCAFFHHSLGRIPARTVAHRAQ